MVRTMILALSVAGAASFAADGATFAAEPVTGTSRIDAVEVYPDGATVSRLLSVPLKAGESVISVPDLPIGLDQNSVRVEGSAGAGLEIVSVDTRRVDPLPGDRKTDLDDDIEALQAERVELADKIATLDDQILYVQAVAKEAPRDLFSAKREGGDGDWKGLLTSVGGELSGLRDSLRQTRKRDQDAAEEIARLEREREKLWPADRPTMEAQITVVADAETTANLTLRYGTYDASWTPIYDARLTLEGADPKLDLVRRAVIRQWSGEDWNDAQIELSTARPGGGTTAPTLPSLLVRIAPDMPRPEMMSVRKMARPQMEVGAAADAVMEEPAPAPVMARERGAVIETRGFDVVYVVPGRTSVGGDGTEKKVRIGSEDITPKVLVRAVPERDTTAYLSVRFPNEGTGAILPGDVQLFRDGVFVGTARIGLVAPKEEAEFGFGSDPAVVVERKVLVRKEGERGLLSSDKIEERRFKITVVNRHAGPIDIEIEDRLPQSENEKIKIEPSSDMTKPTRTNPDDRRGIVVWADTYEANESREILVGYQVRWPADEKIIWSDRGLR